MADSEDREDSPEGETVPADAGAADGADGGGGSTPGPWWRRRWVLVTAAGVVVAGAVAAAVAFTGGGQKRAINHPASTTTTTAPPPGPACPLTGTPSSGSVPQRPALAVKVDNYPDARPQSGLDKADIVFEEPVEGGITRYVAVFQCQQPTLVGPIRSARFPDVAILDELSKPIFVHVGGINPILALINQANAYNEDLFYNGSLAIHPPGRYAPYDTYINSADVWKQHASDTSPPQPIFTYSSAPATGTATASVHIPFSSTSDETWTWNSPSKRWLLAYSGVPDKLQGGGRVSAANVVVLTVQVAYGPWVENSEGGLEVRVDPTSGGTRTNIWQGTADLLVVPELG